MNKSFEDYLIEIFENYDISQFKILLTNQKIFICGGQVADKSPPYLSFRHFFIEKLNCSSKLKIILAEEFKDFFKEYSDLLTFEDDIARIASIVIIFLESPGSLVELGIFISRPDFYNKLLIIAPFDKVSAEDSFIYLGPLEHIKKKHTNSVSIYPWLIDKPQECLDSLQESSDDLLYMLREKLKNQGNTKKFNENDSSHITFLIAEIIRVFYPLNLDDIEYSLMSLNLTIKTKDIRKYLYLLKKLEYICSYEYSGYKFYYPAKEYVKANFINFGVDKNKKSFDEKQSQVACRQYYIDSENQGARKRGYALREINKILK
ncbi:retron St85 family effector protein [Pasteurella sp. PK-2025]|uniref:retron St85 family effector protein n=1 Tax=Pasteurella sp. PK-2025 TaxID=3413133 RepID=UPI003C78DA84